MDLKDLARRKEELEIRLKEIEDLIRIEKKKAEEKVERAVKRAKNKKKKEPKKKKLIRKRGLRIEVRELLNFLKESSLPYTASELEKEGFKNAYSKLKTLYLLGEVKKGIAIRNNRAVRVYYYKKADFTEGSARQYRKQLINEVKQ